MVGQEKEREVDRKFYDWSSFSTFELSAFRTTTPLFQNHGTMMLISGSGGRVLRSFMAPTSTVMIANRQSSSVLAAVVSPLLLSTEAFAKNDHYKSINCQFLASLLKPTALSVQLSSPPSLWRNTSPFVQPGNSLLNKSSLPFNNIVRNYSILQQQPSLSLTILQQQQQQQQQPKKDITVRYMNRNARKAKRANHGKRPCSRIRRRYKTKKWANTCRKG